ncbi:MAG: PAS domain S-box protein, partial [Syntrophales bacterium]
PGNESAVICMLNNSKYKRIFTDSPIGISLIDRSGRIIDMNRVCMEIIGIDDFLQLGEFNLLESTIIPDAFKKRILNGEGVRFETVVDFDRIKQLDLYNTSRSGSVHLRIYISAPAPDDVKEMHYLVYIEEISDAKRMESALKENAERLQMALSAAKMIAWDWDLKTDQVVLSGNVTGILGIKTQSFTSDQIFSLLHPEDRTVHMDKIREAMDCCSDYVSQFRWIRPDNGAAIWLEERGRVICDMEENAYWVGGVIMDITAPKRAGEELRSSRERLRALAANLESVREEERTHIAREIHDEFGQALTGLKMDISWIRKMLSGKEQRVLEKTKSMQKCIDRTIGLVHRISMELRPGILDDFGLQAAIEWQLKEFKKRADIEYRFQPDLVEEDIDPEIRTIVFRVFQETLTNIMRHAGASKVDIHLRRENNNLILTVEDNGRGITEEEINNVNSLGIIGMKERIATQGGEFNICGIPGKGTKTAVSIPLRASVQVESGEKNARRLIRK